jgi:hypothetical protein
MPRVRAGRMVTFCSRILPQFKVQEQTVKLVACGEDKSRRGRPIPSSPSHSSHPATCPAVALDQYELGLVLIRGGDSGDNGDDSSSWLGICSS